MSSKVVQFLSYPDISLLDLAGPLEVFSAANRFSSAVNPPYDLSIISLSGTSAVLSGAALNAFVLTADTPKPHTLIVPGGHGVFDFCQAPQFSTIFTAHTDKADRLVSVCTGVFALAAAGKLSGKAVTTHWSAYDELELRYPEVQVKRGPIFINDGNVWTSAGVTSGIDLALAIVEHDLGHSVALEVARHLVVFLKRPGDQNQFSSSLTLQAKSDQFSDLHAWINAHLKEDLSISSLASYMNMSERTFVRKYTASTGRTPSKNVEMLRLEAVRERLATTRNPLKKIASDTGLGNETTLIRKFIKVFGITPNAYRTRFKADD